jgi:hypothetical protein
LVSVISNKVCRICLSDEHDEDKGFIPVNVCNCKGFFFYFYKYNRIMWVYAFVVFETMDGIKNSEKNKWLHNVLQNKIFGMWNM